MVLLFCFVALRVKINLDNKYDSHEDVMETRRIDNKYDSHEDAVETRRKDNKY